MAVMCMCVYMVGCCAQTPEKAMLCPVPPYSNDRETLPDLTFAIYLGWPSSSRDAPVSGLVFQVWAAVSVLQEWVLVTTQVCMLTQHALLPTESPLQSHYWFSVTAQFTAPLLGCSSITFVLFFFTHHAHSACQYHRHLEYRVVLLVYSFFGLFSFSPLSMMLIILLICCKVHLTL